MATSKPSANPQWEQAQQVQISVNLIACAKQELRFLKIVEDTPALKDVQVIKLAIERYLNCWLPLASEFEPHVTLLPPLDCAWVWHCHKLNPVQYAKDCQQLFGKLVDVAIPEPGHTDEVEKATIDIWSEHYPGERYQFVRAGQHSVEEVDSHILVDRRKAVTYDLVAAVERQTSFYFQVSRPWMYEDVFLQVALERYRGFLQLIKLAIEEARRGGRRPFVVPTYDIDLMWHSHQLCATAYRKDTVEAIGSVLDHDDSDSNREAGGKLDTSFVDTCQKWRDTFGTVYEHAGSLYRGRKPARLPPSPSDENPGEVVAHHPKYQEHPPSLAGNDKLVERRTLQVNLVIFSAKNIYPAHEHQKGSSYYVRVTSMRSCPALRLVTNPVRCSPDSSAEVVWDKGFCLQAELSTQGLRMELISCRINESDEQQPGVLERFTSWIPGFKKKPQCLGEIDIVWERDLLRPPARLSFTRCATLVSKIYQHDGGSGLSGELAKPPELYFSVSITPPTRAPSIFRTLQAPVTDDTGLQVANQSAKTGVRQEGRWITRTAVDHTGQEQFVIRTRWATGVRTRTGYPTRASAAETVIDIHQGGLGRLSWAETKNYSQSVSRASPSILSSAKQMDVDGAAPYRQWSLLDGAALLRVAKPTGPHAPLSCEIHGDSQYTMRLLNGKWLAYEDGASEYNNGFDPHEESEGEWLTLIRYTPDEPIGKASALINWHSSAIEVQPGESVVLVLLICTAISVSLLDMKHWTSGSEVSNSVVTKLQCWTSGKKVSLLPARFTRLRGPTQKPSDGHLGAMFLHRKGLSDMWFRYPLNLNLHWEWRSSMPYLYLHWYDL